LGAGGTRTWWGGLGDFEKRKKKPQTGWGRGESCEVVVLQNKKKWARFGGLGGGGENAGLRDQVKNGAPNFNGGKRKFLWGEVFSAFGKNEKTKGGD